MGASGTAALGSAMNGAQATLPASGRFCGLLVL